MRKLRMALIAYFLVFGLWYADTAATNQNYVYSPVSLGLGSLIFFIWALLIYKYYPKEPPSREDREAEKRSPKNDFTFAIGLGVFGLLLFAEVIIVNVFPKPNWATPPIPDAILGLGLLALDYVVILYVVKKYRSHLTKARNLQFSPTSVLVCQSPTSGQS